MKKTKLIYLWFFFAYGVIVFTGCNNAIKLTKIEKRPRCPTTVEGQFVSEEEWHGKAPAIIFRERGHYKIYPGEIISLDSAGVIFDADRQSPVFDPEPKYYPFKEIETVVDSEGKAIAGKFPAKLITIWHIELHLKNLDNPEVPVSIIETEPNKPFGFCIPPGSYAIKEIRFIDDHSNIDINADSLNISLKIQASRVNYIGDIYLDSQPPENLSADSLTIPYKIHSRPEGQAMAGVLGGAIGGMLYAADLNAMGIIGEHTLWFVNNMDHFEKKGETSIIQNILKWNK